MNLNLVRLGHFHTPAHWAGQGQGDYQGTCETALVCNVEVNDDEAELRVNLRVWDRNAVDRIERDVLVGKPDKSLENQTFHLSGDCPWKR